MFGPTASLLPLLVASALTTAHAQVPSDTGGPVVGALVRYSEESATVDDKNGKEIVVPMTRGWTVSVPRRMTTATLREGDFVASTNQPIDAHTGQSTELRIFEPGYERDYGTRAAGQNGNVETHGTVSAVKWTSTGVELDVAYPGGSRRLLVPTELQVTRFEPISREALKPGTTVRAVLLKDADGRTAPAG